MQDIGSAAIFACLALSNLCDIGMLKERTTALVMTSIASGLMGMMFGLNLLFLHYPVLAPVNTQGAGMLEVLAAAACGVTAVVHLTKMNAQKLP
jgi:hypothetical protein